MPDGPLLVPDACALLDVLRGGIGARPQTTSAIPFMLLVNASTDGEVRFALPELSLAGFDRNLDRVTSEVASHGRRVLEGMSLLVSGHEALPDSEGLMLPGPTPPGVADAWATDLAEAWARSIRTEIDSWVCEGRSDADTAFARDRMAGGMAPCRPGGEGFEDAEIVSCALRLAADHDGLAIFVSSNTNDFCDNGTCEVHSELEQDFAAVGLTLATNWGAAWGAVVQDR